MITRKTEIRSYWETVSSEIEEVVINDSNFGIYDSVHIPDLEEIASLCPFSDLSDNLLNWARVISCRSEVSYEFEIDYSSSYTFDISLCID